MITEVPDILQGESCQTLAVVEFVKVYHKARLLYDFFCEFHFIVLSAVCLLFYQMISIYR